MEECCILFVSLSVLNGFFNFPAFLSRTAHTLTAGTQKHNKAGEREKLLLLCAIWKALGREPCLQLLESLSCRRNRTLVFLPCTRSPDGDLPASPYHTGH